MTSFLTLLQEHVFLRNALLGAAVIGFTNGFFSGFINLRRNALSVSALSHTMLPGIAIAVLITQNLNQHNAFLGALVACLIVGLSSVLVSRNVHLPQDTVLAILYTSTFAFGIMVLPYLPVTANLHDWLFGSILHISPHDLQLTFWMSSLTLVASLLFMRPLLLTLFEPHVAAAQGVPVRWMQYLLFTLLVLTLVTSLQSVGTVLSVGLLVTPGAIILLFTNKPSILFWGGAILGALCSIAGVLFSQYLNLQPGPTIIVLLGIIFLFSLFFSPKSNLLKKV